MLKVYKKDGITMNLNNGEHKPKYEKKINRKSNNFDNQRLQHWRLYLDIVEKKAKESIIHAQYDSWKLKENQNRVIFHLSQGCTQNLRDTVVKLLDSNNQNEGTIVGNVVDYNKKNRKLLIEMDLKFKQDYFENQKKILPDYSSILLTDQVNEIYSQRLKYGLSMFLKGKVENKHLEDFIFDASTVKEVKNTININSNNLLQDNLNIPQLQAINGALESEDLYLIQGPPGTGKTTVISELCYQNAIKGRKTLIVSQTNLAVDNALSKLCNHPKIRALRKGNVQLVQEEGIQFVEDNVIKTWLSNTLNLCYIKKHEIETRLINKKSFVIDLNNIVTICQEYNDIQQLQNSYPSNWIEKIFKLEKWQKNLRKLNLGKVFSVDDNKDYYINNLEDYLVFLKKKFEIIREKYPLIITRSISEVAKIPNITLYYMNLYEDLQKEDNMNLKILNNWVKSLSERSEKNYEKLKQIYINNANVIGVTCISSGTIEFARKYPVFDMVIIDEVSKATPPEIILSVLKAKKIVLVGDHRQLPPMVGNETYEEVAKELLIHDDSIQHLKECLFEKLYKEIPNTNKKMLNIQYRMHPQIMDAINQFYESDGEELGLYCGLSNPDQERNHLCAGKALHDNNHLIWIDMPILKKNKETGSNSNFSFSNKSEIDCIKNVLLTLSLNLRNNGFSGSKEIGVISFYNNQVRFLEDELYKKDFYNKINNLSLRIGSVDKFQGIERDIIICSMVRNNTQGKIGFAKDPRRVNVAFSRAKELLIIVGSMELFCQKSTGSIIYSKVAEKVEAAGGIRNVHDFE